MDVLAKKYIESMKKKQESNRNKHLIELGLRRKEPADSKDYDIFTEDCGVLKYYKYIPIEVTDEEYDEICKYSKYDTISNGIKQRDNTISKVFLGIAIGIWILGAIGSIVFAKQSVPSLDYLETSETVFNWTIFICGILATFISGMMFLGFSEIIKLLQRIVDK